MDPHLYILLLATLGALLSLLGLISLLRLWDTHPDHAAVLTLAHIAVSTVFAGVCIWAGLSPWL